MHAWTLWFAKADCGVARTVLSPQVTVLTTFRGIDDVPTIDVDVAPRLFETRVFGGILDGEDVQHVTRADALRAHAALVEWCRIGNDPGVGFTEEDISG